MSKQLTGNEVRQLFLDFFTSKDHMIEPGASLIPKNDPTLLWINAGVAPLKKYFDGSQKPAKNRITNVQKSIRTNDIENVGKTARHHTFFEMLGNFSIGDYFKDEAIPFAWEFLTDDKWLGIDKDRLYVSVYKDDDQAYRIWSEVIGVDPSHILKTEDNFWEIGKGPGGPDSEIFYDRGEKYDPQGLGEKLFFDEMENDRYVEVWNIVFSQYNCDPEIDRKEYEELPQKNIDTGMGLERLVALMQDAETNFDTDLFAPILEAIKKLAKKDYEGENKMAYRVIADHIRTLVFALSDGAGFSNSGRGYVLRRLLRRAARYGLKLGIEETFMASLVDSVIESMGGFYPELQANAPKIKAQIQKEEEAFKRTLTNGQDLLNEAIKETKDGKLPGSVAFKLYDTYGFPIELTVEICEEQGLGVDMEGFNKEMALQKERARNARNVEDSFEEQNEDLMNFTTPSEFIGYETLSESGTILALFQDGHRVESLEGSGQMIVDPCVFYALSGGQVADHGTVSSETGTASVVDVTKSRNGQHLLSVEVEGVLEEGQQVEQNLDLVRRMRTTSNHSATHLLQSALKKVLGEEIAQQGSYVGPDYLRFDFNYADKLTSEQLEEIEELINEMIAQAHPVTKEILDFDQAKERGAIALFDEKYGDKVRVVTMGDVSMELCAGCHVDNTSQIGVLKIVGEESVGSNTRRITAKTGLSAYQDFASDEKMLSSIAAKAKSKNLKALDQKVFADYDQLHQLQKENEQLKNKLAQIESQTWITKAKPVGSLLFLTLSLKDQNGKNLKDQIGRLCKEHANLVAMVTNQNKNSQSLIIACGKDAMAHGLNANELMKVVSNYLAVKGGGKKDIAQGGLSDAANMPQAIKAVEETMEKSL